MMVTPSTCQLSFNSFLETAYPVGMAANRSCFTQTICHNSINLNRICTNEIQFNESLFQLDQSMHLHFMVEFAKDKI